MRLVSFALASASIFALAPMATTAQAAQPAANPANEAILGEIVVTARRREESLQEVPQVVNAVTGDSLQKLNIKKFEDIQTLVPGLTLAYNSAGFTGGATIRGVSFASTTAAQPTVAFYLNDAVVQSNNLFQAMFDIGQIEVLRGPQGTNRGVTAPSGSITVTTRRPDLSQFGGFIDVTATDLKGRNVNGAINIPIITDVLGVRLAAMFDQNTGDGVRSLYNRIGPNTESKAVRASIRYEPSDIFNANLIYTHLDKANQQFTPVTGPGFAGQAPLLAPTPPISETDRVSVQDLATENRQHYDMVQLLMDSRFAGHVLNYAGGYARQHYTSFEERDTGQNLIGVPFISRQVTNFTETSHELRLSSEPAPDKMFDYLVGAYYYWKVSRGQNTVPAAFLPNAIGPATAPNLAAFDERFQIAQVIPIPSDLQDTSIFASFTAHLGSKTEITGGVRHLWSQATSDLVVKLSDGLIALPAPIPCNLAGLQPGPGPGLCIIANGGRVVAAPAARRFHEEHTIWAISGKHRFSDDLMVYANAGTAYRPPYASTGLVNASNDPTLAGLMVHPSEKSKTYEIGFKWTFLEDRGRLNVAVFRQSFKDFPFLTAPVPYVANSGAGAPVVQNFRFTADPDVKVDGFDIDAAFQIAENWSLSALLSYADGRATTEIPCNDSNFDGKPDNGAVTSVSQFPPGVFVALCPGGSVSQSPYWNATIQTEYVHAMNDDMDVYVRGLLTYYPKNARATEALVVDNYGLLNLYTGVRANDGAWEAGLFIRNALNTEKITFRDVNQTNNINSALSSYPGLRHNSGYFEKTLTPRREFGINVRYAFGSR